MTGKKGSTDSRSAVTGRFVTPQYAKGHPKTTVTEHRSPAPKAPSGGKKK